MSDISHWGIQGLGILEEAQEKGESNFYRANFTRDLFSTTQNHSVVVQCKGKEAVGKT